MKKDIDFIPVEGVQVAAVRQFNEAGVTEWFMVLLNSGDTDITNVFITSKGYESSESGKPQDGRRTSTLRHFYEQVPIGDHVVIEPIMPEVFHLTNEYWVSYYIGGQIYDKKFIFVPDSIVEENVATISALGMEGVLHD